ncbi:hypothetical protein HS1genome_1421 [Sulfodiicoccus acidiphilus]|uniref:Uncharacterized protein n=1 Tax=Sulfodiicoccus acidiphilus TaxID=1670455 RepID=A0A348B4D0_9CREN|nr:hypothetical protein [Sulfodiicoccus acidiphilus]BBD73032.1 hypothetical protein HS1genome_1421 [Sulfodiicoccus acidiphilus]GGU05451.1 hypothetical protein GCM10007116_22330 [Sulfodiicoccus acidiphilus]
MDSEFRTFLVAALILVALSVAAVIYTGSHVYVQRASFPPPTVEVVGVYVTGGNVSVELYLNSSLPMEAVGGEVELPQLNESVNLTRPEVDRPFNVSLPLIPNVPSPLDVTGYVSGYMNGSQIYVTFSQVASVSVRTSISLYNFSYSRGVSYLTLEVNSPVYVTLTNLSSFYIVNANTSVALARQTSPEQVNLTVPYGVHFVEVQLDYNLTGVVYSYNTPPGTIYEGGYLGVILHYPTRVEYQVVNLYLLRG